MSKKELKIKEKVMSQIKENKISMRPRWYFLFGSIFMALGLISTIVVSIFLLSLTKFALRSHGPMGEYRLEQLMTNFPWWAPILALLGLIIGVYLLRKYDFSYKKNFLLIIIGLIAVLIITVFLIDGLGLNDVWFRNGPMKGIMRQYMLENNEYPSGYTNQGYQQGKRNGWRWQ